MHHPGQVFGAQWFLILGQGQNLFGHVEQVAAVPVGHGAQRGAGVQIQSQSLAGFVFGAAQKFFQRMIVQAVEHQHLGARQQSGVQFERRVFRGRADQDHRAVFDIRQKAILLGAVEAMDLVDEQQCPLPHITTFTRTGENLLQVRDAGKHRRQRLEK